MSIKKYKPTSPARRHMSVSAFAEITTTTPGGRNSYGRITVRHIGGGNRQKYRIIDFKRLKDNIPAKVAEIEYDPNRTANIALLHYADGEKRYILAPIGLNKWRKCRYQGWEQLTNFCNSSRNNNSQH